MSRQHITILNYNFIKNYTTIYVYVFPSKVIQFLAISLMFNTFLHLRTKNNFDRYMIERRSKSYEQEIPTPHTHFIPRGFEDSSKVKENAVLTGFKSEEEDDVLFSQDEKKVNIFTVDA